LISCWKACRRWWPIRKKAAVVTFAIAESPERLGPRLTHAEIEQTMRETGLDKQLKVFGMWTEWQNGKRGRAQ
jgi:hypothetical protein